MILYNMRWKNETTKRPFALDFVFSKEIVFNAYREGYINWNVYIKAIEKINTTMNGNWMFDKKNMEIEGMFLIEYS